MSRVVVITGAASGIGRATALAFAERGDDLTLADIDLVGLERVRSEALARGARGVELSELDVADSNAVTQFASELLRRVAGVDVLVNNAGVLVAGGFLDTEPEDWSWILGVNLLGAVHVTKALLPSMVTRRKGHVLNVASASAFWNPPVLAAYGTSKYALVGLSEALREEMRPHGVRVTAVCPALVSTPIVDHMRLRGSYAASDTRERARSLTARRGVMPEVVASAIVRAAERDIAVLPVGKDAWTLWWLKRLVPGVLSRFASSAG